MAWRHCFFRAFWPDSRPSAVMGVAGDRALSLARDGDERADHAVATTFAPGRVPPNRRSTARRRPRRYTWAELAWLLIGTYWIVLGLFVIPARLHEFKLGDMVLFGLVPFAVALALRLFGPRTRQPHRRPRTPGLTWPPSFSCRPGRSPGSA